MHKGITVCLAALLAVSALMLAACGKTYECSSCRETTTEAYYDMGMNENRVLCPDCARKYWTPFPIDGYRVR